jgi:hypothetical protein
MPIGLSFDSTRFVTKTSDKSLIFSRLQPIADPGISDDPAARKLDACIFSAAVGDKQPR